MTSSDLNSGEKIPPLKKSDHIELKSKKNSLLKSLSFNTKPPFLKNTVCRLIECIGGLNYTTLIEFDEISELFEVKIIIIGITSDKCGVNVDEVFWESSFVNDLGID